MRTHILAALLALIVTACASHQNERITADDQTRATEFTYLEGQAGMAR